MNATSHLLVQWNLWITTLRNEDILWNKDTSSGPKVLFSVQIALWNEDTSELGTLLVCPKGVLISQVSLYMYISCGWNCTADVTNLLYNIIMIMQKKQQLQYMFVKKLSKY
jgi:hypothetical protein